MIVRSLVLALALIGVSATIVHAQPLSPFATAKATTLLREKYGCLGCHRLGEEGGQLAPALHDVRTRRDAAYIAAIIRNPQQARPGAAMPRTRMPEADRALITRFLGGDVVNRDGTAPPAPAPALAPADNNGAFL